ncbi:MAG: arylsulfatase [Planctomycetota bacterium]|nr:MAG: arylsulfatase [Planctomycetota bacterium]
MKTAQTILALAAAAAWIAPAAVADGLAGSRPNIILVMTDDQGYGDLGCHGNPVIQTPNLDRMYEQSVRLTDFQVSPTCSPTRASLMTGRHEFKSGVTHTIFERERLGLHATTIAEVLNRAGYATGIFGKWHLGDEADHQPDQRGFDEVYIHGAGGIGQTYAGSCGDAPGNEYFDPALTHNGKFVKTKGYCTDLFFAQALKWIEQQSAEDGPFFAYITPNAPHGPLVSPGPQYDKLYEGKTMNGKKLNEGDIAFYSMITNIDDNMGKLLERVDQLGIAGDTLVIFMTDNGGTHTRLFSAGMRAGKGSPYEGGTHVPSFWRWPGTLSEGVDVDALTAHIDYFPTFVELAGTETPEGVKPDGRSLVPLLEDPGAAWADRYIFVHQGRWPKGQAEAAKFKNCAVRNSRFRLVNNRELYDLQADPGETTNVIDEHPQVVSAMREAYDAWWQEALAGMVNEDAVGPKINPVKARYWKQFGGGPDAALLERMDPAQSERLQGRRR